MKSNIDWEMRVAVISTVHMPKGYEVDDSTTFGFTSKDPMTGPIIFIEDLCSEPQWLHDLAKALVGYNWVRFDPGAHQIEGLPVFNWD